MMVYGDYRFDPEHDTLWDMDRKIRARAMHSGGFFEVGDRRIYTDRIISQSDGKEAPVCSGFSLTETEDSIVLIRKGEWAVFGKCKITDKEGKLLWKRGSDAGVENGERERTLYRPGREGRDAFAPLSVLHSTLPASPAAPVPLRLRLLGRAYEGGLCQGGRIQETV